MRLVNDARLCNGHLRCCAVAPDLLEIRENEDAEWTVSIRGQTIDVPPALEEQAREAVVNCPEEAYALIDTDV